MRHDDHDRWRDERAADLRERDRQREPHRHPRCVRPSQSAVSIRLECPRCSGPVYVSEDCGRVRTELTCAACAAPLVTSQGADSIVLTETSSNPPGGGQ